MILRVVHLLPPQRLGSRACWSPPRSSRLKAKHAGRYRRDRGRPRPGPVERADRGRPRLREAARHRQRRWPRVWAGSPARSSPATSRACSRSASSPTRRAGSPSRSTSRCSACTARVSVGVLPADLGRRPARAASDCRVDRSRRRARWASARCSSTPPSAVSSARGATRRARRGSSPGPRSRCGSRSSGCSRSAPRVKAIFEQLGPQEPNYRRVSLEVRIETPWWLPDVTFRVERVRETPQPEIDAGPVGAAAVRPERWSPGAATETAVATTTLGAAGAVHPIAELRALPVRADRGVGLGRAGPGERRLDDRARTSPSRSATRRRSCRATAVGAGRAGADRARAEPAQRDATRSPRSASGAGARFGPDAGVWTDLLAPADSEIGGLDDLLDDPDLSVTFASAVRFRWDADVIDDNSDRSAPAAGQRRHAVLVRDRQPRDRGRPAGRPIPSFPCCSGKRTLHGAPARLRRRATGRPRARWCSASPRAPARCAGCCRGRRSWPAPSGRPAACPSPGC